MGYGVSGSVQPGATVKVFHPLAPGGETITADPITGVYGATWIAPANWNGGGVSLVEITVRGTLVGGAGGGNDAVADQKISMVMPATLETLGYDGAGRLIDDGMWTYTWDGRGYLTGMTRKAGTSADSTVTGETLGFGYDGDGRRTSKVRTLSYASGSPRVESSRVLWDGWLPVMEERTVNGAGLTRRWYVWGRDVSGGLDGAGGIGGLVAIQEEGGRTLYPVEDGLGNITALVNGANGATVARYDYGPYGEVAGESGEKDACPFRWQSKYYDGETGLNYFGYRYYSAKLGRWLSRDPLGEAGGFNLYAYCGNDPVNKCDYLGMADMIVNQPITGLDALNLIDKINNITFSRNGKFINLGTDQLEAIWNGLPDGRKVELAGMVYKDGLDFWQNIAEMKDGGSGSLGSHLYAPPAPRWELPPILAFTRGALSPLRILIDRNAAAEVIPGMFTPFANLTDAVSDADTSKLYVNDIKDTAHYLATTSEGRGAAFSMILQIALTRRLGLPEKPVWSGGPRLSVLEAPIRTTPYGTLTDELGGTGLQANHINQNAAFKSVIPAHEGLAVGMRGNAFTEIGSPHFEFHASLEKFWTPYRKGGDLFGQLPTNAQYGAAVEQALICSGYTPAQAAIISAQAAAQRTAFGLEPSVLVPRVPGRLPQKKP